MATNLNTEFVNEFSGGMNSDTGYDYLKANQYVFAKNVRITTNTDINSNFDHNTKEGTLSSIPYGDIINFLPKDTNTTYEVLATASVENIGAIIIKLDYLTQDGDHEFTWKLYKLEKDGDSINVVDMLPNVGDNIIEEGKHRFSVTINKELDNCVKIYIADGVNRIMIVNLLDEDYYKNITSVSQLISRSYFPTLKIRINKKISGQLPTGLVQYCYRYYKKYGVCSKMSPITNKIQIIDNNRSKQIGNAQDTITSIGLLISLRLDSSIYNVFDHILIYRVSYKEYNHDADVELIYDQKFNGDLRNVIVNDTGINSLQKLSIMEFASLDGSLLVPDSIDQNQGYLFSANVKDETVLRLGDFDAKAYQYNTRGEIRLFKEDDTTYGISKQFDNVDEIEDGYVLNRFSDVNFEGSYDDLYSCFLDREGYVGGTGKNVSWRFVSPKYVVDRFDGTIRWEELFAPEYEDEEESPLMYYIRYNTKTGEFYFDNNSARDASIIFSDNNVCYPDKLSYNDIITSSLVRSLQRDEVYRYGIVLYNKYGDRSFVLWIADIRVPQDIPTTEITDINLDGKGRLYIRPIGIEFSVKNLPEDIVGYQIVRCPKYPQYTKNILQVASSRPIRLELPRLVNNDNIGPKMSPYYPHYILNTNPYLFTLIDERYISKYDYRLKFYDACTYIGGDYDENDMRILELYSPYIIYRRNDALSLLKSTDAKLKPVCNYRENEVAVNGRSIYEDGGIYRGFDFDESPDDRDIYIPYSRRFDAEEDVDKLDKSYVHLYYYKEGPCNNFTIDIKDVQDVYNPTWELAFSNHQISGGDSGVLVTNVIKLYKSFQTSIDNMSYVNWICNGMYDHQSVSSESHPGFEESEPMIISQKDSKKERNIRNNGTFSPGGVCFIAATEHPLLYANEVDSVVKKLNGETFPMTTIYNIQHTAQQYGGYNRYEKQYDSYVGFGNFTGAAKDKYRVFDGDIYIEPFEIIKSFKAFDFNSIDTLDSSLHIYYVPIESKINTYFDYGMNYMNTKSKTLQLEPGDITGVISQDRPAHQYNMIYSDNDQSNDIYVHDIAEEESDYVSHRIHYSQLKVPGEFIDNWSWFLPINYIDVDARYGKITHIKSVKDILYFWQNAAFGKLNVNERSLITDNNSNQIQLGTGGVVQKADYLSVRYGMKEDQYVSTDAENTIYWIDGNNRAIIQSNGLDVINMSERLNVLNILNSNYCTKYTPTIEYDVQNNELLCNCLVYGSDRHELVFNIKLGVATSVYNRNYMDTIKFNNVLYGIQSIDKMCKYNYVQNLDLNHGYRDTEILYVVNPNPSITKVFDNQEVVMPTSYNDENSYFEDKRMEFVTNISSTQGNPYGITNREGNIRYALPRIDDAKYGNRIRGKWMKVRLEDYSQGKEFAISHIITKYRQSFS